MKKLKHFVQMQWILSFEFQNIEKKLQQIQKTNIIYKKYSQLLKIYRKKKTISSMADVVIIGKCKRQYKVLFVICGGRLYHFQCAV